MLLAAEAPATAGGPALGTLEPLPDLTSFGVETNSARILTAVNNVIYGVHLRRARGRGSFLQEWFLGESDL